MQKDRISRWEKEQQTQPASYTIQLEDIYPPLTQILALVTIYNDSGRMFGLKLVRLIRCLLQ